MSVGWLMPALGMGSRPEGSRLSIGVLGLPLMKNSRLISFQPSFDFPRHLCPVFRKAQPCFLVEKIERALRPMAALLSFLFIERNMVVGHSIQIFRHACLTPSLHCAEVPAM